MGVVFNGLTTIAGFGSLLVAHHRGVWSLGLLLVIGSAMTLTASLVVLPTLVRLADRRQSPAAPRGPEISTVPSSSPLVIPGSNDVSHPRQSAEREHEAQTRAPIAPGPTETSRLDASWRD